MSDSKDDLFFELYKINIACYYNSKIILKIINDQTTNISPTIREMLVVYETNSDKIKKFNNESYITHQNYVKTILCKLFSGKEDDKNKLIENGITSFLEYFNNRLETGRKTLINGISRVSEAISNKKEETKKLEEIAEKIFHNYP